MAMPTEQTPREVARDINRQIFVHPCHCDVVELPRKCIICRNEDLIRAAIEREREKVPKDLLRCTKGHIHNQPYGKPCPMCELDCIKRCLEGIHMT
jgi:hypothetical protein